MKKFNIYLISVILFTSFSLFSQTNTSLGTNALNKITTGTNNTGIGYYSLYNTTTGASNSASGAYSLYYNTSGAYNTALGYYSLLYNTTGNYNSAFGTYSLYSNTTGIYNTAMGYYSLLYNTTGSYNTALGRYAGSYANGSSSNYTGTYSVFLGADTKAQANGQTNQIVIGYNATGAGSNTVTLGNDQITKTLLKGEVEISGGRLNAGNDFVLGTGNKQFIFHTQSQNPNNPPIIYITPKLNATEWDWNKSIIFNHEGKVGIGGISPAFPLHVQGKVFLGSVDDTGGWSNSYLYWNAHSLIMGTPVGHYAHNSLDLKPGGVSQAPLHSQIRMYTATGENQHELKIHLNSMGDVVFNNNGKVGIGTTSPLAKLHNNSGANNPYAAIL
ncbi:MAG: hypothetical protein LBN23_02125, partial [Paludibacter sp.]|nr:hypothetical protein [Paludibacter sp.]